VIVRSSRLALMVTSILLVAASVSSVPQASAQPRKTLEQVQAEVRELETQAETASENVSAAQIELASVTLKLKASQADVSQARQRADSALVMAEQMAAKAYMSGGGGIESSVGLLLAESPTDFLDQLIAVQQVARSQNTMLSSARSAQLQLAQAEAQLAQQQSLAAAASEKMTRQRDEINRLMAAAKLLLAQLQASDRARLDAIAAQERAASGAAASAARTAQGATASSDGSVGRPNGGVGSEPRTDGSGIGSGSDGGLTAARGLAAVRYALTQVGKPYSYSASPPNSWDCSKLTAAAWAAAGVSLTPVSYAQANEVRRIPRDQLRPGDLLFYFNGAHHVAMYIGGGKIVEAASPEHGVWVTNAWNSWSTAHFSFAGRPVG
jgi:cell wall-associated NlpC family hydrolase